MQLNIKSIKREGQLEFDETVRLPRIAREDVDIADVGPVHVKGTATWADPLLMVEGEINTMITYICSRCLTHFDRPLTTSVSVTYTTDDVQADDEIKRAPDDVLDLTSDLEESIFLAVDDKPLCRKDCKGLCPECGGNRNEQTCSCDTRKVDPRLAALKDLLSDDDSE
ncbi:YceD family protein [Alicyclobacillus dauci]|uniref:DUF177 domain-containing protein n=1 Tax=Alicyclobacillus dauci TaxID=1475485 RepID=A0ABY6YYY5_9BACL|nr:DUF177 domain-containing protein [Alicyclobacillus dauci]WAH35478.1 DUF177 domain-containing protein [Alicyclobacillus dauci]